MEEKNVRKNGKSRNRTNNPLREPTFQIGAITILPSFLSSFCPSKGPFHAILNFFLQKVNGFLLSCVHRKRDPFLRSSCCRKLKFSRVLQRLSFFSPRWFLALRKDCIDFLKSHQLLSPKIHSRFFVGKNTETRRRPELPSKISYVIFSCHLF